MIFHPASLPGAAVIEPEPVEDERGLFARVWSQREFAARGLGATWVQSAVSYNAKAGTLRGIHYQAAPHAEAKLVRCTRGAIYDVIVDIRPMSAGFLQWAAFDLTADNRRLLYVPEGFAHGFQTIVDGTEVFYEISAVHHPEAARGLRWDDPRLGIAWPIVPPRVMSPRDRRFPDLEPHDLA